MCSSIRIFESWNIKEGFYHCISCPRTHGGTLKLQFSLWEMMLAWWRLWIYVVIPISLKVRFLEQWEGIRSAGTISRHCRAHHRPHFPWVYHQKIISRVSASFQTLIDASISRVYRSYTTFVLPCFFSKSRLDPSFNADIHRKQALCIQVTDRFFNSKLVSLKQEAAQQLFLHD